MARDIIVTTPISQMETAAQEARDVIEAGGGFYFRNLSMRVPKELEVGDRCFYVENGFIRGYCTVSHITDEPQMVCETSGREFGPGLYVFMDATTWAWIKPIYQKGFQGWRYSCLREKDIVVLGGWLDPRPEL